MNRVRYSRREMLSRAGAGFGMLGLSSMLSDGVHADEPDVGPMSPKRPHFAPRAKHVIFLFMNGGPSHVDTFDPKPELEAQAGEQGPGGKYMPSPFSFAPFLTTRP